MRKDRPHVHGEGRGSVRSDAAAALLAAAVLALAAPAGAQDLNLAQGMVDSGDFSGAELEFLVIAARHHRDRVEWRRIVERETLRMEAERPAPEAPTNPPIDPKALFNGPLQDYLKEQEAYRLAEEAAALDPKRLLNGPLTEYLERQEAEWRAEDAADIDPKALLNGPLVDYLKQLERESRARRQLVGGETEVVQAVERWARVVVDSTGEVIENDPIDVAHAKLEDLIRRQEDLDARMRGGPTAEDYADIIAQLRGLDAELDLVLNQIGGAVWRSRSTHRNTCFPGPVPNRPVAVFNCHYWAAGLPRVLDAENIILDRVRLDVDEDANDVPVAINIAYFWRYGDNPPSDEPGSGSRGEVRHTSGGRLSLVFADLDDNGNERERSYPLTLTERSATATLPGFDGHGPFTFTFARDEANYVPWSDYQAAARGQAPDYRREEISVTYEDGLSPLEAPAPAAPVSMPAPVRSGSRKP